MKLSMPVLFFTGLTILQTEFLWTTSAIRGPLLLFLDYAMFEPLLRMSLLLGLHGLGLIEITGNLALCIVFVSSFFWLRQRKQSFQVAKAFVVSMAALIPLGIEVLAFSPTWFFRQVTAYEFPWFTNADLFIFSCSSVIFLAPFLLRGRGQT